LFENIKILTKIPDGVKDGGKNKNNLMAALMIQDLKKEVEKVKEL
jgi:hypothetical protein